NYMVSDLDAVIAWDPGETDIRLLSADFCGLDIFGRLTLDQNQPDLPVKTDLTIQAADQENITPLLACFFPDLRLMEGSYSFSTRLTGNGPATSFQNHLNGPVQFESHNGQIHKMTLLSRLLSVLNILKLPDISQEGFRYNSILVSGQVKNGVIHLEKAVIDAENMALIFTGRISPFENNLNLTCLVAPLKTIDTIIKHIPIVNTILSGRLVSFPARATGAIDDPVITPLHPSAVGEGLINMLTSIIKVPVRLFEGTP
ncbi:MAG: AsmA-like C-terminal region-containing protein, partial [Desulfobacteraceae bacterium]|nr:AsmA-like C-terminal region-containing protein [Desulfobacteraceae bacterium]